MAYINASFTEGTLINDLQNLLTSNGWTLEKTFKKYAYPRTIIDPNINMYPNQNVELALAEHRIFKNSKGTLYGIARLNKKKYSYQSIQVDPKTDEPGFRTWLVSELDNNYDRHEFFVYMLEQIPTVEDGTAFGCAVDVSSMRGAIDIEVINSAFVGSDGYPEFQYTESHPEVMQSPFVEIVLRNPNLESVDVGTNWWVDSVVKVNGVVDQNTLLLVLQADNTPAFENNVVPLTPLYMGEFVSFDETDVNNYALWGGTAFNTGDEGASKGFDFDSVTPYRNTIDYMPVLKTYPSRPANGIDNIIVKRSKQGARYQAYYLSWNTVSNKVEPDRIGINGGKYPNAWKGSENDEYKYKFSPSAYSGKVHTSMAYLIHADEGVRGYLSNMILLSPFGLINNDKLKVKKASCPNEWDIYRFFLTEAISPITKRPSSVYRPAGLGIFEQTITE